MTSDIPIDNSDITFFPMFTVVSNDFEKDLEIVRTIFSLLSDATHATQRGFKLSERAETAAGWWFYDIFLTSDFAKQIFKLLIPQNVNDVRRAKLQLVDSIQEQLRKQGSEAKIKMHGDMPFAAPWWAWLMS
jgi:hypothetical protein